MNATVSSPPERPRGPWGHRLLIWFCGSLLGLLAFWLLGFVLHDITVWRGPDYATVERQWVPETLRRQADETREKIAVLQRAIQQDREQQQVLGSGAENARQTMDQLLAIQRLSLEQEKPLTDKERRALAESEQLFLEAQRNYQTVNERIARNQTAFRELEARQRELTRQIEAAQIPARAKFAQLHRAHNFRQAALKLAVLLPLLALVGWGLTRRRDSLLAPPLFALSAAVLARVLLVMHDHFPARLFKYVLLLSAVALVSWILAGLVRMVRRPRRAWLLKQYREAYERFLCPICAYPIRRGPHRFRFWNRRTAHRLTAVGDGASSDATAQEPYTCPVCATRLFERCPECQGLRHSLLPACCHCGAKRDPVGREMED